MAKVKRLILKCEVDKAQRKHVCKHNKNHVIQKGDLRLTLTLSDGRATKERYCKECAIKMIEQSFEELNNLKNILEAN